MPLLLLFPCSCSRTEEPEIDQGCYFDISNLDFSFGIDHNDTLKYLIPGEQSYLKDIYLEEILEIVGEPENDISYMLMLCAWINRHFTFQNAGGGMIGIPTEAMNPLYAIPGLTENLNSLILTNHIKRPR